MSFLVDTNVVSELRRKNGDARVKSFVGSLTPHLIFFSVLTLGEIRRGALAQHAKNPRFSDELLIWLHSVERAAEGRILPVTLEIGARWAELTFDRTRSPIDALLAATASVHKLTVLTRNVSDFVQFDVPLLNPWTT